MNEKKTHIPGIYNYCDRWCEKCSFTSNCLLFTNESKITTQEILNDGEFPDIEKIFDESFEDEIENGEEENDFDFDFDDDDYDFDDSFDDEYDGAERRERFSRVKNSILSKLGDEYFNKANTLVKELTKHYNISDSDNKIVFSPDLMDLFETYETVNWYHMFIKVKIDRALQGKMEYLEEDDDEMKDIASYDMNGTAKIAAIAVDNSINALNKMLDQTKVFENEISELLVIAGKLKNLIDEEFPEYKNFIRPGLDE